MAIPLMACYLMERSERTDRHTPLTSCVPSRRGGGVTNCSNRKGCSAIAQQHIYAPPPLIATAKRHTCVRTLDEIRKTNKGGLEDV